MMWAGATVLVGLACVAMASPWPVALGFVGALLWLWGKG